MASISGQAGRQQRRRAKGKPPSHACVSVAVLCLTHAVGLSRGREEEKLRLFPSCQCARLRPGVVATTATISMTGRPGNVSMGDAGTAERRHCGHAREEGEGRGSLWERSAQGNRLHSCHFRCEREYFHWGASGEERPPLLFVGCPRLSVHTSARPHSRTTRCAVAPSSSHGMVYV